MPTKKTRRSSGKHTGARHAGSGARETPVALTLKVDGETYVRLSVVRATERRTNQDILQQALKEYLERVGA
jgi:hypothetical protein